jgi:hypothetical protein
MKSLNRSSAIAVALFSLASMGLATPAKSDDMSQTQKKSVQDTTQQPVPDTNIQQPGTAPTKITAPQGSSGCNCSCLSNPLGQKNAGSTQSPSDTSSTSNR